MEYAQDIGDRACGGIIPGADRAGRRSNDLDHGDPRIDVLRNERKLFGNRKRQRKDHKCHNGTVEQQHAVVCLDGFRPFPGRPGWQRNGTHRNDVYVEGLWHHQRRPLQGSPSRKKQLNPK